MLSVRFGSAESGTEASLHTYGALLLTYNICSWLILNGSTTLYASSDAECQIRRRQICLHTYGALLLISDIGYPH
jgi:hypothetical protein